MTGNIVKKVILALAILTIWFFSGTMPDSTYKVMPSYFPDTDNFWQENPFDKASISQLKLPLNISQQRKTWQADSLARLGLDSDSQILFGDTHVHTTNSSDAFKFSLPLMHGAQGAFPPGYACDYARFASQLDFYFLTDHAEAYTPERWQDAIDSVAMCNKMAQAHGYQDVYAFMGYEWTQVGVTAENHYGHHNVLFKGIGRDELPARPIAAIRDAKAFGTLVERNEKGKLSKMMGLLDPRHSDYYSHFNQLVEDMAATPDCEKGIPSPELPQDCFESAQTPADLFKKLDEWNMDSIVIPHGMSWGWYTPPGSSWASHMDKKNINNERMPLIEVFSGHGASERYGAYEARLKNDDGSYVCPPPHKDYLPSCHQAGVIIKNRCLAEGLDNNECEARAQVARQNYVNEDTKSGFLTVPGDIDVQEWLDAGQARDVFLPAYNYRPRKSAQYGLALRNFDDKEKPLGYEWGFVGSTDTHTSRAGHGYKQVGRLYGTEANGARTPFWEKLMLKPLGEKAAKSRTLDELPERNLGLRLNEIERSGSFFYLGGIAAVHAKDRSRDGIWNALKAKQTYATSGHRILLWVNLMENGKKIAMMGDKMERHENPQFKVTAVGSPKQKQGCPKYILDLLDNKKLEKMAFSECYYPTQERYKLQRLEVIRIRPQSYKGEAVAPLIEDPWKVFECPTHNPKCEVSFTDNEFKIGQRDALYYVRAIEEKTLIANGNTSRNEVDTDGNVIKVNICSGSYITDANDDCLSEKGHQAVSSPIYTYFK